MQMRSVLFTMFLEDANFGALTMEEGSALITEAVQFVQGSPLPFHQAVEKFQASESYFTATHPPKCPVARAIPKYTKASYAHRSECNVCAEEAARIMAKATGSIGSSVTYVKDGVVTATGSYSR